MIFSAIMTRNFCAVLLAVVALPVGLSTATLFAQTPKPDAAETTMMRAVDAEAPAAEALLEKIVNINSGTMNLPGVIAVKDVIMPRIEALGFKTRWVPMEAFDKRAGDLVAEHPCPAGTGKCGKRLLLIGHLDTVFELNSSFQKYSIVPGTDGKVATGPGVGDMKGGLVVMLSALNAMKVAGVLDKAEIVIVLSGDEERHGDPTTVSRRDMIEAGKHSDIALEFENGSRVDGKDTVRTSRRSALTWTIETSGRTGHSSGVFNDNLGFGAIYELVRILDQFRVQLREDGLTYNVGLLLGGATAGLNETKTGGSANGKSNVVAPTAIAQGDLRTLSNEQTARVEAKMQTIVADHLPKTGATIEFAEGYPAMAETKASKELVVKLNEINATLGFEPEGTVDPRLGGAGDIAFVAPYVPGLVGVGALGAGAHAEGETVFLDSLQKQSKRMAILMYRLGKN
jgi:glutamate carboxypeptidase